MTAVVFTGPTLAAADAAALLPATVLPPARQGDLWRAVRDHRPVAIGLIDGVFLHEPAVWHREILWALSEGVHVFGAASMGALRAAELAPFGMTGSGRVFAAYRDGVWPDDEEAFEDDDEVAVIHAPPDVGSAALSDAMVDLRETLAAAEAAGLMQTAERRTLAAALKRLAFPERSFAAMARLADTHLGADAAAMLRAWLPAGRVARKRLDALQMLRELATFLATNPPPFVAGFRFEHAQVWDEFIRSQQPDLGEAAADVLEELRLCPQDWRDAARAGLGRLHALAATPPPADPARRAAFDAFRRDHAMARRADLDTWLLANAVAPPDFARLLHDEAALAAAIDAPPAGLDAAIAAHLRLTGRFAPLLRRARAKRVCLAGLTPPAPGPLLDAALAWFTEATGAAVCPAQQAAIWREYVFRRRAAA